MRRINPYYSDDDDEFEVDAGGGVWKSIKDASTLTLAGVDDSAGLLAYDAASFTVTAVGPGAGAPGGAAATRACAGRGGCRRRRPRGRGTAGGRGAWPARTRRGRS